jgi:hypothetical protein
MAHQLSEYRDAGFCAHLAKPIQRAALLDLIADLLSGEDDGAAAPNRYPKVQTRADQGQ